MRSFGVFMRIYADLWGYQVIPLSICLSQKSEQVHYCEEWNENKHKNTN